MKDEMEQSNDATDQREQDHLMESKSFMIVDIDCYITQFQNMIVSTDAWCEPAYLCSWLSLWQQS